ncbi:MAG: hypothetical protein ACI4S1_13105 [Roseburia sp.]
MNHMAEVAKMLGVELGEEFCIKEQPDIKCVIYNDNLYVYPVSDGIYTLPYPEMTLGRLLNGSITIKRKPWNPKKDEKYWLVNQCGNVISLNWIDNFLCITNYKIGNCYRTKEEAEANRDKWVAFYASDEVLEV